MPCANGQLAASAQEPRSLVAVFGNVLRAGPGHPDPPEGRARAVFRPARLVFPQWSGS